MAVKYGSVVTTAGKQRIILAAADGTKVDVTRFAVGDANGSAYEPSSSMTALRNVCYEGVINDFKIDPSDANTLVVQCSVPADVGGFTIREIGVYTADGVLFALSNVPDIAKTIEVEGAVSDFIFNLYIAVSDASVVNVTVDPSLTFATNQDVIDLRADMENLEFETISMADIDALDDIEVPGFPEGIEALTNDEIDRLFN